MKELRTQMIISKRKDGKILDAPAFDITVFSENKKKQVLIKKATYSETIHNMNQIEEIQFSRREWKLIKEHIDCMFDGKYKK